MHSSTPPNPPPLAAIAIRQVEKSTGASRNAFEQAAALQELGYRVVILAERGNADLVERAGATFVRLPRWPFKGAFRRFWFNRRVQSWCKRHAPALLVSHGDAESRDVIYLHNCVHLASQRIHGRDLPKKHEVAAIHDHVLKNGQFCRVAVNSRMMAEDLKNRYGLVDSQLEISYPGYDPEQFNPARARQEREAVRQSLGVGQDEFLIGLITSGNFKKRNVAGFVEIAALLNQRLPDRCRFLVVGKDDASPYRQQADALGLNERFIWRSTMPDIERLYGALDVFTLPAHIEEFGRVALEAMACGTPVLLSAWVGAAEVLEDDFNDLILAPENADAWATRIAKLLERADREHLGLRLAERATHYSHTEQYKKLKASFQSLDAGNRKEK
ncbi:UDP-glucose:(heptosyl)LPS alpha-1,3-glucosyltransferase [Modicisalibacter ilicicola DSM 19980]|uniref:UDP-glucose:(Heptosyl)LPS alpha-1,3-glucosyltransferase n=1 Tax=Modicisalibacter ilicicola DSM 19980 TaxID=1121942 RepID=A0A1M5EN74_9GAMM|nr:glycosyltransferase family 4 protein [Halomonas ilicicola]SHF80541.1 UDP-glucose:(heptosyl)LPS alpha-1,3-glucosyltransferase [Halomonas ilicicola DSM 19980]